MVVSCMETMPSSTRMMCFSSVEKSTGRRKPDYWQMWPIALAPSIPIIGMAFKNHPRVRNILIGGVACGVLVYAHGAAVGGSKDVTG